MSNRNLNQAKEAKNDEFYTQLTDIEKELKHYRHHFKNKIVYCNCDDPKVSNFFKYFTRNFEHLGLKKVIATCYKNQLPIQFSEHQDEKACYMVYEGDQNKNRNVDDEEIQVKESNGDGDFRSPESIEFLKEADIVCTNPPFSLFKEYVHQLTKFNKKFLIIGNQNAITYKEIFPLIKENKMWFGINNVKEFEVKKDNSKSKYCYDRKKHFQKFGNVNWYTNLTHSKRNDTLHLIENYLPEKFPTYDNYNAIEVKKVVDIPKNYGGGQWVFLSHFFTNTTLNNLKSLVFVAI
ncbi:MAG: modification methylase [Flavobacteriaceae bacterium]|nr:modification methylase [Flavobacteriaceae bacterium]